MRHHFPWRLVFMNFKEGLRGGLPIGLGYFSVSLAFGVLASQGGCTLLEAVLISMTNLTSAGQFAGLSVIAASGTLIEMALTQLVVNARYALMSIALSQKLHKEFTGKWRWLLGFAITDEIFAVAVGNPQKIRPSYFAGLALLPFIGWSAGTFSGAVRGNILPEIVTGALGVALYGMFIAIVTPKAKEDRRIRIIAAASIALSATFHYTPILSKLSGGFAMIICAVVASAAGALLFPVKEEEC